MKQEKIDDQQENAPSSGMLTT